MKRITKLASAIILFTMLWTGTFLHDFFGIGLTPYAQDCPKTTHQNQVENVSQVLRHCHSPWADSKTGLITEALPEIITELSLPQLSQQKQAKTPVRLSKSRDAPIYLVKCSLLI